MKDNVKGHPVLGAINRDIMSVMGTQCQTMSVLFWLCKLGREDRCLSPKPQAMSLNPLFAVKPHPHPQDRISGDKLLNFNCVKILTILQLEI